MPILRKTPQRWMVIWEMSVEHILTGKDTVELPDSRRLRISAGQPISKPTVLSRSPSPPREDAHDKAF